MTDAIAQAVILTVMNKVVMNAVAAPLHETDRATREGGDLAVVDRQIGELRRDSPRRGKLVVVLATGSPGPE